MSRTLAPARTLYRVTLTGGQLRALYGAALRAKPRTTYLDAAIATLALALTHNAKAK